MITSMGMQMMSRKDKAVRRLNAHGAIEMEGLRKRISLRGLREPKPSGGRCTLRLTAAALNR